MEIYQTTMPWRAGKAPAQWRINVNQPTAESARTRRARLPARFASERVPGRARRIFEIADIGAEPQANAGTDRHQHDIVGGQRRHAEAADDVGRAVDADEALIDRLRRGQVVDQRHGARAVAAPVEADRRALPEDAQVTGILGVERAFAIA